MNRRSFFKFLGIGAATAAVVPKLCAEPSYDEMMENVVLTIDRELRKDHAHQGQWKWKREWGALTIYEEPGRHKADYSIGVVAGYGIEGGCEPSCVSVTRIGEGNEPDVQVAEYLSTSIALSELPIVVANIARLYANNCTNSLGPILVIEQVRAPGDLVQNQLKIMGFKRFFQVAGVIPQRPKQGWYSNRITRPLMIGRLNEAVENGWYKPKSARLVECMVLQTVDKPRFTASALSYMHRYSERGV